jgi:hypothetical protein
VTLPASGPLSLLDLATEFGGSAPHSIDEYYRGGSLVPNTSINAGVPVSGQISLSNFYGASSSTPNVVAPTTWTVNQSGVATTVRLTLSNSGGTAGRSYRGEAGGALVEIEPWGDPLGIAASNIQIRLTPTIGTWGTSTVFQNVWANFSSTIWMSRLSGSASPTSVSGILEFRNSTTLAILRTVTLTLNNTP